MRSTPDKHYRLFTYNSVTSGVGGLALTGRKVVEALPGDVGSEDVLDFLLVGGLLESVGQRSDPREWTLGGQILKEHGALVSTTEIVNHIDILYSKRLYFGSYRSSRNVSWFVKLVYSL